ncbi:hypothetical protein [[Mycobacterium] crassicus]|uniref:Secreted protein n=1 Tax=[Mycobacterium] crassicus TaxID=2872309 RepID=A0ABU5XN86_9MYCO|nr:hypothetical protein [Mycolicibacter sp. MYC098]MEB3023674.1 hypothetical protein [Mycolicibacter sp. MYC098]
MIRTTGKLAAGAACGVLFVLGTAPAAQANQEAPAGRYTFSAQHGPSQRTATWTFTPCGPTCVSVDGERWLQNGEFHLAGDRWEYKGQGTMDCPVTHAPLPVSKTASFDAVTLAGQWTTVTLEQCGRGPAGGVVGQWDFQLTKIG